MTYKIAEMFYSLQGEGAWAGTPATFVRLAGCSVGCAWCDTDYKKTEDLDAAAIARFARTQPATRVIVTGGEPTDQQLGPLVEALHGVGLKVHLETSGVRPVELGTDTAPFDWITVSPKSPAALLKQTRGNECKVVFAWPQAWLPAFLNLEFEHFFIQPLELGGKTNVKEAMEYVLAHPRWRLSLQTHKLLGIR